VNLIRKVLLSIALVMTPVSALAIAVTAAPAAAHPDNGYCEDIGYYTRTEYHYDYGGWNGEGYSPAGWYQADFYDLVTSCEDGHSYYNGYYIWWTYLG
jgi:hypothetical protein